MEYEHLSLLFRLKLLKETYYVFNRGGFHQIVAFESVNNSCTIFLVIYTYFLLYKVNWKLFFGENHSLFFLCDSYLCRVLVTMNIVTTIFILCWGIIASFQRIKTAQKIHSKIIRKLGKWPTQWCELLECHGFNFENEEHESVKHILEKQLALYLCSENRLTKMVFKIIGIAPSSWFISRYFVWAVHSSLSINRSAVLTENSNVNIELFVNIVDKENSKRQILFTTFLLFCTTPFFFLYYSCRIIIQEFHKFKSGNNVDTYTWSIGSKFALKHQMNYLMILNVD